MNQVKKRPEASERVAKILEIGQLLVSTLDFDKVLTLVMGTIRDIFFAEVSSLLLVDPETEDLVFTVALGPAGPSVKQIRLKKGEGLAGAVAVSGVPLLVEDVDKDKRHLKSVDDATEFSTQSMIVAPLKIRDSVIGIVEVINCLKGDFTSEDMDFLMMLTPFAAIAIDNARYSENLEKMVAVRTDELEKANQRLREIDSTKSEFLSTTAHELKTPLGAIKTFLSLLAKGALGPVNDDQKEIMDDCTTSIDRLVRLINGVLSLARIEAGVIELNRENLDVGLKIEETIRLLKGQASEKQHRITMESEPGTVYADPDKLTQILINFTGNAIKYTPAGGLIKIIALQESNAWTFKINDSGPGMTPEQLGELFVRFKRLKDVSREGISGTGLGLVITKKLVEMHGGRVNAYSKVGEGSTFEFTIPYNNTCQADKLAPGGDL